MYSIITQKEQPGSAVGIVTDYGLDDRGVGVRVPVGSRILFFHVIKKQALGLMQPPIQWVPGAFSLGLKRPGREADHLPPTSAEVKKTWMYTSTPQYNDTVDYLKLIPRILT
jgi:hypothetical protein